jgi:hypothetical protein
MAAKQKGPLENVPQIFPFPEIVGEDYQNGQTVETAF